MEDADRVPVGGVVGATARESFGATVSLDIDTADDVSPADDGVIGPIAWIEVPRLVVT